MSKTSEYLYNICFIVFFLGSPNFWIEDLKISKTFAKTYRALSRFLNFIIPFFIVFELGAFITQTKLSKKQESDLLIYGISHPMLISYSLTLWSNEKEMKLLISEILKILKVYKDELAEDIVLRKSKRDSTALTLSCIASVLLHTTSALMQVIKSEGTFTTVLTTWPLVDDNSTPANGMRIIINIIWWVFVSRVIASFITVITLTTSMTHLYLNLQSYFYSLAEIFEGNGSQWEKEQKYEEAFIVGINEHSKTIECFTKFRNICKGIFGGQIIFVILMLVFLMTQMTKSERTLVNASATALTAMAVLISTGFFLWNAGDITIEASNLSLAMYFSGWHNCQRNTFKMRQLMIIAMTRAQKPVVLKGLGIMTLCYQSYVTLVKSSYSVFSVIY